MSDNSQETKPNRRFIAGLLLFLLAIGTWRNWSRADHRFIGTWHYEEVSPGIPLKTNTYHADGRWEFRCKDLTSLGSWRVRGDQLRFRSDDSLASPLRLLIDGITGHYDNVLKIKSIDARRMELQRSDGEILTYHRIPE